MPDPRPYPAVAITLADLLSQRETMTDYLQLRVDTQDWHGVRDAASDIEVIEAKLTMLGWKR